MSRGVKFILSLSFLVMGFLAAMVFRVEKTDSPAGPKPCLVLKVPTRAKAVFPASQDRSKKRRSDWTTRTRSEARPTLAVDVPPPELARRFPERTLGGDQRHKQESFGFSVSKPLTSQPEHWLHKVVDGDTLETLAQKYLGDPKYASTVFKANVDQLTDTRGLPIGVELRIPSEPPVKEQRLMQPIHSSNQFPSISYAKKNKMIGPLVPIKN
jgi:nucleoid-associated protein YgaU